MNKNILPNGMRDLVFEECNKKNHIINEINEIFRGWRYKEVNTPTIEFYSTFLTNGKKVKEEELYKFFDNNGRILALRGDMTVPIARVACTKLKDVQPPLKICYTSNVYRVNESFDGKRNEFTDCGIELIGDNEKKSNLEVLLVAIDCLNCIGIENFKIEIGNINIFKSLLVGTQVDDVVRNKLASLIENKSLKELNDCLEEQDFDNERKEFLSRLPWLFGGEDVIDEGLKLSFNKEIRDSLNEIKEIYKAIKEIGNEKNISVDLGMVPGEDYYTGIIFKGYVEGVGELVLRGGRYDNLLKGFGRELNAVGFSINIDGLLDGDLNLKDEKEAVILLKYNEENFVEMFKKAKSLRDSGENIDLVFEKGEEGI